MSATAKLPARKGSPGELSSPGHSILAELSVLHELSGLAFTESQEELAREAVEKVTRLFGARCFALVSGGLEQGALVAASGLTTLQEVREKLEKLSDNSHVLKLVFNEGSEDEDVILFEHTAPLNDQTRRLVNVFARRLEDRLTAFRLQAKSRLAEKALIESEEMLRKSQEAAGVGSYSLDLNTRRWKGSSVLYDLLGLPPGKENTLEQWLSLVLPPWRQRVMEAHDLAMRNLERFEQEYKIIRGSDGRERWVHEVGRFEGDEQGRPVRLTGTIMDITERKITEKEKEKLQAQLNHAQKLDSVGQLAGGVAHDFNNMLSVILGYAELALAELSPSHPLHDSITQIHRAATRSADITRQLLAFARKQAIAPEVLELNEVIESTLKVLERLIGENIDLIWSPSPRLWPVRMDPFQMDQILTNLCINARDAISSTGTITIETGTAAFNESLCRDHNNRLPGEYVFMSVADDGCGMSQETLASAFEPFFTTKAVGRGSGLGLSTVYGIVTQNQGFVEVESVPGKGSTFTVYFPRHKGEMCVSKGQGEDEIPRSRGETLLVVEDEPSILKLVEMMLQGLGYTVLTADSPRSAIHMALSRRDMIHLLITDVVMPHMSGKNLSDELHSRLPHLKTLYMSGYTSDVIAHRGVLAEGVYFIQKPFSLGDLARKVREVLQA